MIALSKLTTKHQTTLPRSVIDALHAVPGNQIVYIIEKDRITLQALTGKLADLAGKFAHFGKKPKRAFTLQELNDARAEAWVDRSKNTKSKRR